MSGDDEKARWIAHANRPRSPEDTRRALARADAEGLTVCDWCGQPFTGPPGSLGGGTTAGQGHDDWPCPSPHMHNRSDSRR